MFWRLRYFMFGTDFVHMANSVTEIIRPIKYTYSGERYVKYFSSHFIFIDKDEGKSWKITKLT